MEVNFQPNFWKRARKTEAYLKNWVVTDESRVEEVKMWGYFQEGFKFRIGRINEQRKSVLKLQTLNHILGSTIKIL